MTKNKKSDNYEANRLVRSEESKTVRKIVAIIIVSLVLIFIVGGISSFLYIKSALEPVKLDKDETVEVTIPLGSSSSTIASILEENGVIKDARVFRFYTKFKNISDFQAGEYTFTSSLTMEDIFESLQSGKIVADPFYKITIPEGKTIEQMAVIFSNKLPFSEEEFLKKVNDTEYIEQLIAMYPDLLSEVILEPEIITPLEGYLFPATYSFYEEDPSIELVINNMLKKTVEIVEPYEKEIKAKDLTMHEGMTLASVIENEAKTEEQRKKIAGVIYNRLDEGMKLQTDPTVLYALGKHKDKVLLKDLEIESPYNTYYTDALPIGPISNFSEVSLVSVIEPEDSDILYYLHDKKGNIHYSTTHDEHVKLKKQYIK